MSPKGVMLDVGETTNLNQCKRNPVLVNISSFSMSTNLAVSKNKVFGSAIRGKGMRSRIFLGSLARFSVGCALHREVMVGFRKTLGMEGTVPAPLKHLR